MASPNFDARPIGVCVDLLVIHCISLPHKQYGTHYVEDLFMNRLDCTADPSFKDLDGQLLSAHGFIRRQGQLIQFVELSKRAWHAGESHWQNRVNCNDFSIGIELEGSEDESFTDAQYRTLVDVIADTVSAYPGLSLSRIVGHHEIAPHRKTDPGLHFDWLRVFTASQQRIRAGH